MLLGSSVYIGACDSALDGHGPRFGINTDRFHLRKIDKESTVANAVCRIRMTSALD